MGRKRAPMEPVFGEAWLIVNDKTGMLHSLDSDDYRHHFYFRREEADYDCPDGYSARKVRFTVKEE